ncbi:MAG: 5-nucleotidase [Nevskia sp.]|nr:5-nucleotidase [Nevskia sp.]
MDDGTSETPAEPAARANATDGGTQAALTIAISSRAVFELDAANQIWQTQGIEAYREHQRQNEERPLEPGPAYPFVKRLLQLNGIRSGSPLVEVVLLSRNDPDTGLRAFNSIEHHGLPITRAAFLSGSSPYRYLKPFDAALFLSMNADDVNEAIAEGYPAGLVLPTPLAADDTPDHELRIAFDFDGVIADDEAESVYKTQGLPAFQQHEREHASTVMNPGPLKMFIDRLATIQEIERGLRKADASYRPRLRTAIITARDAPAHRRCVLTLRQWGIRADETFFLGGREKKPILEVFRPHLFFDDQRRHLDAASTGVPCAHIPFGIRNRPELAVATAAPA